MEIWIFIAVLSAAAVTELIFSAQALKRYSVIIPVTDRLVPSYSRLEDIYRRMIAGNRRALMILFIDGADDDAVKICRTFSSAYDRTILYFCE